MHAVIIRFTEPGQTELDEEVYGPFADGEQAGHWTTMFEAWFTSLTGDRTIEHMLITAIQNPAIDDLIRWNTR